MVNLIFDQMRFI